MKTLEEWYALPYRVEIAADPEGGFVAKIPDLPGCLTFGETEEEAIGRIEDAKRCWIAAALEEEIIILPPGKENG